jgi:murein DD-endopeptidase MepM/ murein hydrolase activator NlpD
MGKRIKLTILSVLILAGMAVDGWSYYVRRSAESKYNAECVFAREEALRVQQQFVLFTQGIVPAGVPFGKLLQQSGVDAATASRVVASAQTVFDMRHVRGGNRFAIGRSVFGELRAVRYWIDPDHVLSIAQHGDEIHSTIDTIPSQTLVAGVTGTIRGSLFEGVLDAGEKPELALRLADIFGWDLDFYTDPRPGDTFRVVVEKKKLENGDVISYERILAAEYINGDRAFRAVLFHDPSGKPAYYTPEGKSMKKAFLHSPLKFAAPITSHFSESRYHPILKEYRPHLGIDYGAPTGTPVQAIGDGRVIFAGPKGGAGNLIEIKHSNDYTTYYMHLSRILVKSGQRVEQGQRIGLVGMTGLATGPHLDFRVQKHGQFVNFLRLPLPPSDPVAKSNWTEFCAARDSALAQMPGATSPQEAALAKNATTAPDSKSPVPPPNR